MENLVRRYCRQAYREPGGNRRSAGVVDRGRDARLLARSSARRADVGSRIRAWRAVV